MTGVYTKPSSMIPASKRLRDGVNHRRIPEESRRPGTHNHIIFVFVSDTDLYIVYLYI